MTCDACESIDSKKFSSDFPLNSTKSTQHVSTLNLSGTSESSSSNRSSMNREEAEEISVEASVSDEVDDGIA